MWCLLSSARLKGKLGPDRQFDMMDVSLRDFAITDTEWRVVSQGLSSAAAEGYDDNFYFLVPAFRDPFDQRQNLSRELGRVLDCLGSRMGSLYFMPLNAYTGRLRLFLVMPIVQEQGTARQMRHLVCRMRGMQKFQGWQLWTDESRRAAYGLLSARVGSARRRALCILLGRIWSNRHGFSAFDSLAIGGFGRYLTLSAALAQ